MLQSNSEAENHKIHSLSGKQASFLPHSSRQLAERQIPGGRQEAGVLSVGATGTLKTE
jgi:hypothetical protein